MEEIGAPFKAYAKARKRYLAEIDQCQDIEKALTLIDGYLPALPECKELAFYASRVERAAKDIVKLAEAR